MESTPVVLDMGTSYTRAGLADDADPRVTVRTFTGRHPTEDDIFSHFKPTGICQSSDDIFVGEDMGDHCGHLVRTFPVSRGVVVDTRHAEVVVRHVYGRMKVAPETRPLMVTEPPFNPKSNRETLAEILLENLDVPSLHIAVDTPLALFGLGRTSGVAVSCGEGVTSVAAVYEGNTFTRSVWRQDFAGKDVSIYLANLLAEKGNGLPTFGSGLEHLTSMKETVAQCASLGDVSNGNSDVSNPNYPTVLYTLPDGNTVPVGDEQAKCTEVLFHPNYIGKEYVGLHTMINDCIQHAEIDTRREMYRNIILTGGTAKIPGLADRIHREIETICPDSVKLGVTVPSQCVTAIWSGAANMAARQDFRSTWVTREEWREHGAKIIHKKCWSCT